MRAPPNGRGGANTAEVESRQFTRPKSLQQPAVALIEHEPFRVFRYSLDGGRTWLTCVSTLRGDTTAAVKCALDARHGFPVKVREFSRIRLKTKLRR